MRVKDVTRTSFAVKKIEIKTRNKKEKGNSTTQSIVEKKRKNVNVKKKK